MMRLILTAWLLLLSAMLMACAPESVSVKNLPSSETRVSEVQTGGRGAWQLKWEETLAEAKKEGRVSLYTWLGPEMTRALRGASLDGIVPEEGLYISAAFGNLAFFNQSPHPRAAKIFINWLLAREGQELWARSSEFQSARKDIPVDYIDPVKVRKPGVKYITVEEEDFLLKRTEIQKVAREIFGPLLRLILGGKRIPP